jgi:hypothetical protein
MGGLLPLFLLVAPLAIAIWDRRQTGTSEIAYTSKGGTGGANLDRTEESPATI